jgi:hypothetical protein
LEVVVDVTGLGPFTKVHGREVVADVKITLRGNTHELDPNPLNWYPILLEAVHSLKEDDTLGQLVFVLSVLRCIQWLDECPCAAKLAFSGIREQERGGHWWAPSLLGSFDSRSLNLYDPEGACHASWGEADSNLRTPLTDRKGLEGYVERLRQHPRLGPMVRGVEQGEMTCRFREERGRE